MMDTVTISLVSYQIWETNKLFWMNRCRQTLFFIETFLFLKRWKDVLYKKLQELVNTPLIEDEE